MVGKASLVAGFSMIGLVEKHVKLPAVKKDTIFGAARKNFGPSYFVTALDDWPKILFDELI